MRQIDREEIIVVEINVVIDVARILLSWTKCIGPSFHVYFKAFFAVNPFSEVQQALVGADPMVNWQFY